MKNALTGIQFTDDKKDPVSPPPKGSGELFFYLWPDFKKSGAVGLQYEWKLRCCRDWWTNRYFVSLVSATEVILVNRPWLFGRLLSNGVAPWRVVQWVGYYENVHRLAVIMLSTLPVLRAVLLVRNDIVISGAVIEVYKHVERADFIPLWGEWGHWAAPVLKLLNVRISVPIWWYSFCWRCDGACVETVHGSSDPNQSLQYVTIPIPSDWLPWLVFTLPL